MKILVIGSEGFIGKHCVDHFLQKGDSVTGLDLFAAPTCDYEYIKVSRLSPEFEEIFRQKTFDAVINAAGNGNVSYSMTHPLNDFESNCLDTIRILDAIKNNQPACKYIHLSSAAVYGNPESLPIKEEHTSRPVSPYGWNKHISEQICRQYTSIYNIRIAALRPFSVYGAGLKKQLFWDHFQKYRSAPGEIELFGTGNESRDFIYVTDVAKAVDCIIHNGALNGEVYNIASGNEITIKDAIAHFWKAYAAEPAYYFNGRQRAGDPLNWRADISKLTSIGFQPTVTIQEGMQQLTAWLKKIYS